ncbi:hypothetical protein C8R43DRAFT_945754 [Mycena crocata]|nr:hypothetical protein C8R43DRAFT_945754 [Mycena crocata]
MTVSLALEERGSTDIIGAVCKVPLKKYQGGLHVESAGELRDNSGAKKPRARRKTRHWDVRALEDVSFDRYIPARLRQILSSAYPNERDIREMVDGFKNRKSKRKHGFEEVDTANQAALDWAEWPPDSNVWRPWTVTRALFSPTSGPDLSGLALSGCGSRKMENSRKIHESWLANAFRPENWHLAEQVNQSTVVTASYCRGPVDTRTGMANVQ